uniref:Secreted protein n=1 Tax=Anguilla anguilla TaxID=7936 RepID=A0A0E9WK42_ANGAN
MMTAVTSQLLSLPFIHCIICVSCFVAASVCVNQNNLQGPSQTTLSFAALGTVLPSRVFNTLVPGFGYTLFCTSLWIRASAKCL